MVDGNKAPLANKVAILTGAATLLGAEVAGGLVEAGARVLLVDIAEKQLEEVARSLGEGAVAHAADVRDDDAVSRIPAKAEASFGQVDILVNMAAIYDDAGVNSTRAQWIATIDVNLISAALMAQACVPLMKRQGGGTIVNITSAAGKIPRAGRWTYPVSKAGLLHLTRVMALDLAVDGIRVVSVSPGWVWSNPIAKMFGNDRAAAEQAASHHHMLPRMADPGEIAQGVVFLCSPAAAFITGTDLAIDGGSAFLAGDPPAANRIANAK